MTNSLNTNRTVNGSLVRTGVYNDGSGLKPLNSNQTYPLESTIVTRSGGNTAGYHNPKRAGVLKPTSMSYYKSVNIGETGYDFHYDVGLKPNQYGYVNSQSVGCRGFSGVPGHSLVSQSDIDKLSSRASNSLLTKIKSQSVNVAQGIGERKQTMRLIGDTALRLASSLRALKKGDFPSAARNLGVGVPKRAHSRFKKSYPRRQSEAVSQAWLELQYGWKPLLSDVYGAAEQLAKQSNRPIYQKVTARQTLTVPLSYRTKSLQGKATSETVRRGTAKATVIYSCVYVISSPNIAGAKEMGLTNPALLAWELLPFSFVADWFMPIGGYLGTLDATLGCTFSHGYKSVFQSANSESYVSFNGIDNYSVMQNVFWSSRAEDVRYERTTLSGFPSPALPSFKNPASLLHAANAIALLTQLFRK
jgi:hypothetical protein